MSWNQKISWKVTSLKVAETVLPEYIPAYFGAISRWLTAYPDDTTPNPILHKQKNTTAWSLLQPTTVTAHRLPAWMTHPKGFKRS